jgi:hypothetical protein
MDLFLLSRQAHLMEAIFSHLLHAWPKLWASVTSLFRLASRLEHHRATNPVLFGTMIDEAGIASTNPVLGTETPMRFGASTSPLLCALKPSANASRSASGSNNRWTSISLSIKISIL